MFLSDGQTKTNLSHYIRGDYAPLYAWHRSFDLGRKPLLSQPMYFQLDSGFALAAISRHIRNHALFAKLLRGALSDLIFSIA